MATSTMLAVASLVISITALLISFKKYDLSKREFVSSQRKKRLLASSFIERAGTKIKPLGRDLEDIMNFQKKMASRLTFEDLMELSGILLQIKAEMERLQSELKIDLAKLGYSLDEISKKVIKKYNLQDNTNPKTQNIEDEAEMFLNSVHGQKLVHLQRKVLGRHTKAEAKKLGFILNRDGSIAEVDPDAS